MINFDKIESFDMNKITNKISVIVGKRAAGKTTLIQDYLFITKNKHIDNYLCIERDENSLRPYIKNMTREYDTNLLETLINKQRELKKEKPNDTRGLFIMDYYIDMKQWRKDTNLSYLFLNGARSNNITTIITQQYYELPPAYRENIDYLFLFKNISDNELLKIWNKWNIWNIFETYECFKQILDKATENYGCLVIENGNRANFYIYKSILHNEEKAILHNEEEVILHNEEEEANYGHINKRIKICE